MEKRRNDMKGIEAGIDRETTVALHGEKAKLTEYDRSCLRAILTGAVNADERRHRHRSKGASTNKCPFCSYEEGETIEHRWWHCPQWNNLRRPFVVCRRSFAWGGFGPRLCCGPRGCVRILWTPLMLWPQGLCAHPRDPSDLAARAAVLAFQGTLLSLRPQRLCAHSAVGGATKS